MSRNASVAASSWTMLAGASPRTILQKMQSGMGDGIGPSLRRRSERPVGDDQFLDFVRAFVEAEDPGIAVVTLHVEVAAEPVPAVDLDRPIRDALCHLRPVQLRHGNLERVVQ